MMQVMLHFIPTWMLSAWSLVMSSIQNQGFEQIIDIGSGDGRIAYCGKVFGLDSISIEIDENLSKHARTAWL